MNKPVSFKNRDKFIQLGIAISTLRKIRGLSQEELAHKANISRTLLGKIEAPNMAHGFSMEAFFDIADALDIAPVDLLSALYFPDNIINKKQNEKQGLIKSKHCL